MAKTVVLYPKVNQPELSCVTKLTREIIAGKKNPERDYTNRRAKKGCPKNLIDGSRGMGNG